MKKEEQKIKWFSVLPMFFCLSQQRHQLLAGHGGNAPALSAENLLRQVLLVLLQLQDLFLDRILADQLIDADGTGLPDAVRPVRSLVLQN